MCIYKGGQEVIIGGQRSLKRESEKLQLWVIEALIRGEDLQNLQSNIHHSNICTVRVPSNLVISKLFWKQMMYAIKLVIYFKNGTLVYQS